MFGIGGLELLVILVVALLVLGPKKLPELARTLGKAMGEFRRVSTEFQRTLNTEIALDDMQRKQSAPQAAAQTPGAVEPAASAVPAPPVADAMTGQTPTPQDETERT